jgi:hypothetical protein
LPQRLDLAPALAPAPRSLDRAQLLSVAGSSRAIT